VSFSFISCQVLFLVSSIFLKHKSSHPIFSRFPIFFFQKNYSNFKRTFLFVFFFSIFPIIIIIFVIHHYILDASLCFFHWFFFKCSFHHHHLLFLLPSFFSTTIIPNKLPIGEPGHFKLWWKMFFFGRRRHISSRPFLVGNEGEGSVCFCLVGIWHRAHAFLFILCLGGKVEVAWVNRLGERE